MFFTANILSVAYLLCWLREFVSQNIYTFVACSSIEKVENTGLNIECGTM